MYNFIYCDMKNTTTLQTLFLATAAVGLCGITSCCEEPKAETPSINIIESTEYVGLWQKEAEIIVTDDEGNEIPTIQATNLYKCILPDGTFFLFRAYTNGEEANVSQIELYGTYQLSADTLCTEVITCHCINPALTGITSELHYSMPGKDQMNVWYNLLTADGSSGSNEWTPETWRRVSSVQ